MTSRGWVSRGIGVVLACGVIVLAGASAASANSGSLSVSEAGNGSISVKAEATFDQCGGSFCAWFAAVRERHASLPCENDRTFTTGVVGFEAQAGSVRGELTFKPFFPRSAKLCLYVTPVFGGTPELVAQTTYRMPDGYGRQRNSQYTCGSFDSQAAAQYYLYLYPEDPSHLDPERDGAVCAESPCPCDAEPIPPEPPAPPSPACLKAQSQQRLAGTAVKRVSRKLRKADGPVARRHLRQQVKKRKVAVRRAKTLVRKTCAV